MVYNTVITYPIPAYSNVPIESQYYLPSRFVIIAITIGQTTTITTSANLNYAIGQLIRLLIPPSFGSRKLNESTGYVISKPALNQVTIDLNSIGADPFILSNAITQAQIIAIGDINNGATNRDGRLHYHTFIPGSFIDISPF